MQKPKHSHTLAWILIIAIGILGAYSAIAAAADLPTLPDIANSMSPSPSPSASETPTPEAAPVTTPDPTPPADDTSSDPAPADTSAPEDTPATPSGVSTPTEEPQAIVTLTPAPTASSTASGPTVTSDLPDYPPGATVTLTGKDWQPQGQVRVTVDPVDSTVTDEAGLLWKKVFTPTAGPGGDWQIVFNLPTTFVALYKVTAVGPDEAGNEQVITYTFTDSQGNFSKPYAHWSDEPLPGDWNNNILNDNKSNYFEGEVIPHVFMYGASNNAKLVNGHSYSFNVTYNYYQQNTDAGGFAYMTQYDLSRQPNVFDWATPAVTPNADSAFSNGGGMAAGANFYTVDADITGISAVTYTGTGTKDGVVTITFTYTGTETSNGYAAVYYGLYVAKPGEVPDQGAGKTNGANAWSGGSLQTTVDIGGSGATSIQLAPSAIIPGEISGLKFNDLNGNGARPRDEPGLAGWTINVCSDSAGTNVLQSARPRTARPTIRMATASSTRWASTTSR